MPSSQPDETNDFQFLAEMDEAASASTEAAEAEVLTERLLAVFLDSRALQAERLFADRGGDGRAGRRLDSRLGG